MRKFALLATTLFVFFATFQSAQAQIQIGPRIGYDIDTIEELFIGGEARIGLPALPVQINPSLDYYMTEGDGTFLLGHVNALYNFGFNNQVFTPYVGAGLAVARASGGDESDTKLGFDVLGGASFGFGSLRPFVQAQITFLGEEDGVEWADPTTLGGGLLFNFGN